MKEYLPENTTSVDFFASLDKEVASNVLDRLLKTTADLYDVKLFYLIRSKMSICLVSLVIGRHLQNHACIYLENGMVSIAFLTVFVRTKGSSVRHKGKVSEILQHLFLI